MCSLPHSLRMFLKSQSLTRRFGETVAVNRGMYVKTFDNPDDALGWLGIAPANNPDAGDGK